MLFTALFLVIKIPDHSELSDFSLIDGLRRDRTVCYEKVRRGTICYEFNY